MVIEMNGPGKKSEEEMLDKITSMPCPVCKVPLNMTDRQGVEIDYCPQCRGVWLDGGELDQIIERSAADIAAPPPQSAPAPDLRGYGGGKHGGYGKHGYRRKSWLHELFD